jgi:hypothetical protein
MSNINKRKENSKPVVPVNPNDGWHEIMAVADQAWGRGVDATAARTNLRRNTSTPVYAYYIVPKGAWVDEMGRMIEWRLEEAGDVHKDGACPLCNFK